MTEFAKSWRLRARFRLAKWLLLLLPLLSASLWAAVIRGEVVENLTGKPLSRCQILVQPIGPGGQSFRINTSSSGGFEVAGLRAGAYLVTATRANFAPMQYGQKDFRSAGLAIVLEDAGSTFLNIRLPRLGVVSGRVVDQNDVGLPNHEVAIYRNLHPPELVKRVAADERGAYRIYGLDPGSYLVRTVAKAYDEGSYVPTFSKDTTVAEEARPVDVDLDREVNNVDVLPKQGILYPIGGVVLPGLTTATGDPVTVKLTMASDMGRETVETNQGFRFPPVAPGDYEFYAEGPGNGSANCFILGGYLPVSVKDQALTSLRLPVPCVRETLISFTDKGGQRIDAQKPQLLARRKDLAGIGETVALPIDFNRVALPPGRWELMLKPPPNFCVVGFSHSGMRSAGSEKNRPDGWNEVVAGANTSSLRFILSSSPGAIHGLVSGLSHEPLAGAPVYLEGYDADSRKRVTDLQMALTDSRGNYQFRGLSPGTYRVLASFEFQHPDAAAMEFAGAKLITIQEAVDTSQDLDLSVLR